METTISQKFNTKSLLKFAYPSILMMLFVSLYAMTGSIFSAKFINEFAFSAINIVFPFTAVALAISIMFATGANAIIAKTMGEGNYDKARSNFTLITVFAIAVAIILASIAFFFPKTIIQLLGSTEQLDPYCIPYLKVYSIFFPFLFLQILSQYFFVTIGKSMLGLIISLVCALSNVVADYFLIVVCNMGIVGAAVGAGMSYVIAALVFLGFFITHKDCVLHFVKPKWDGQFLLKTCTNGSSEMVINISVSIVTLMFNITMLKLQGENGVAAIGVINQLQFVLQSIFIGFGAGVAPVLAYAYGADDREQIKTVFKISILFISIISIIIVSICTIFSNQIVRIFLESDSGSYALAVNGLGIYAFAYLFAGINIFSSSFFTAMSNGKISALISFLRTFAFIVISLLTLPKLFGLAGVFLAIPIAEFVSIFVVIGLLIKYRKVYHY